MALTIYRWDDASAPTLTGQAGMVIALLDACLVNGYGSKAAAGWTKPYTGTNLAAFQQGTGSNGFFLRVSDTGTTTFTFRGYETMSDVNTGTGDFPTAAQAASGLYSTKSSTADATERPWLIAADAKRFYMWVGYNVTTTTGLATTNYMPMMFFGDLISFKPGDAYATLAVGSTTTTAGVGQLGRLNEAASVPGHYLPRKMDQTGTSIATWAIADIKRGGNSNYVGYSGLTYPDPATGGMLLSRVIIFDSSLTTPRGYLPGFWAPLHTLPGNPGDTFSGTSAGGLSGRTFVLLDCGADITRCRCALETSDTWET